MVSFNDLLYFTASDDDPGNSHIWRSDGTSDGTFIVNRSPYAPRRAHMHYLTVWDSALYFNRYDLFFGEWPLWRSDGTSNGATVLTRGLAYELTPASTYLIFSNWDRKHGHELWRSDGTVDGTKLLFDIVPGRKYAFPGNFHANGDSH